MAPHNLWLQCPSKGEIGQYLRCILLYGHHFEVLGVADRSESRVVLEIPGGVRHELTLEAREDGLVAGFSGEQPGVHTLLAEYDLGLHSQLKDGSYLRGKLSSDDVARIVHFKHFAKALVTIGDQGHQPGSYGMPLEIIPLRLDGDEVELLIQANGRPLGGSQVFGYCKSRSVSRFARTNADGICHLGVFPGEWMFIARLESEGDKGIDALMMGTTLTLIVE